MDVDLHHSSPSLPPSLCAANGEPATWSGRVLSHLAHIRIAAVSPASLRSMKSQGAYALVLSRSEAVVDNKRFGYYTGHWSIQCGHGFFLSAASSRAEDG